MLSLNFTENEARIIGCLMEKSVTTPDQYPLTLNALTNACNQKSSREPVMSLPQGTVQHDARHLESKHLLRIDEGFKRGVEKYAQRFCNTAFSELQFDTAQFAVICLLLLRGPQTPGELRTRSQRMHEFADNNEVVATLNTLIERDGDALVVQLPLSSGRRESEYMHLFCGPVDVQEVAEKTRAEPIRETPPSADIADLVQRLADLEAEVAEIKRKLE